MGENHLPRCCAAHLVCVALACLFLITTFHPANAAAMSTPQRHERAVSSEKEKVHSGGMDMECRSRMLHKVSGQTVKGAGILPALVLTQHALEHGCEPVFVRADLRPGMAMRPPARGPPLL